MNDAPSLARFRSGTPAVDVHDRLNPSSEIKSPEQTEETE